MVYHPNSGLLEYYINDEKRIEYDVGNISNAESSIMGLEFSTWGWYTGHYHHFDNILISQSESSCTYAISPSGKSFGPSSGSDTVSVACENGCPWSATSNADWITITSGDSGTGSGTVGFRVSENSASTSRTGGMTIAGKTFSVIQDGTFAADCEWSRQDPPSQTCVLYSLWGSSGTDVFAVGYEPSFPSEGTIIHYDGNTWSGMVSGHSDFFMGVWGSSGNDVFVVGGNDSSGLGSVIHYDGTSWTSMECGTTNILRAIWGSSEADVFAVGSGGTILHYNGAKWTSRTSGTTNSLYGVWGSSSTDVFAVGENGTILHYEGNAWSSMNGVSAEYMLRGVWGFFEDDVYAVGWGNIFHYDGASWSAVFPLVAHYYFFDAWGTSGVNIFAVGYDASSFPYSGVINHYEGISWNPMTIPSTNDLYGVWGCSGDDVFAVGRSGTIFHYGPVTAPAVFVSSNGDCGTKSPCYSTIQDAIDAASSGADILVKQGTYSESVSLGSDKLLRIKGCYNSTYAQQTANTTFIQANGSTNIKASKGRLKFEMIKVK